MGRLILKFGGAAVASPERFSLIADLIIEHTKEGSQIIVVVSAMGNTTETLLSLARQVHPSPPKREQDMLISVGERISMALLAMALDLKGKQAVSFTGSQAGLITTSDHAEARIVDVKPHRLIRALEEGKIVIVAGFQGVSREGEITTIGRGGSDTTAVALAIASGAEKVIFYKDVPGIFNEDPKQSKGAFLFSELSYEEALKIIRQGAKVLHHRCVEMAAKNGIPLQVLSFIQSASNQGTWIGSKNRGDENRLPIYEAI